MKAPVVFKLGGEALTNKSALAAFLQQVKQIQTQRPVVIVHGGGPQVEDMMVAAQLQTEKVDGLRCTPDSHLPFVLGALAGVASQQLLGGCKSVGLNAIALSLADADCFASQNKDPKLGHVGETQANKPDAIQLLLDNNYVVLLSSIGNDAAGNHLNINADDAAVAAAQLLDAELCLLSNVPGVLDENKVLIPELNKTSIDSLIAKGVIKDGMAVKVNAAYDAAVRLRRAVNIGSWQDSDALSNFNESAQITLGTQISAA